MASANIRHGLGPDGRVDLERTAVELRALGADVIGVQEIDAAYGPRSGHAQQPTILAELLGMQVAFGAALDLPPARADEPRRRYGVALLTRHEILSQRMHPLPDHPATAPGEPRGVLQARLRRADGEELDVLVTHLEARNGAHRTAQVQGIVRLTDALAGPVVLMGDMNADPAAPELAALPATGWQDAAQLVESAPARASSRRILPPPLHRRLLLLRDLTGRRPARPTAATHPAGFPVRRIDALWVRGGITVSAVAVGPRGSSDHRAVTATLQLPR